MFWDDSEEDEEAHLASLLSGLSLPEHPDGGVDEHWTRVDSFKTSVGVDDVDQHLLTGHGTGTHYSQDITTRARRRINNRPDENERRR